jgi:hypothetical protein
MDVMNTTLRWTIIAGIAILVLAGFYFASPYLFSTAQKTGITQTIGDVNTPATKNVTVSISGVYWGVVDKPANESEICSNQTMNANLTYVVEATTAIKAANYDACYIKNNDQKTATTVTEMHDYFIALTATAETDRANNVKACCLSEGKEYCSEAQKLYLCVLK